MTVVPLHVPNLPLPVADPAEAVRFMNAIYPDAPWQISVKSGAGLQTRAVNKSDPEHDLRNTLTRNPRSNIYFAVNPPTLGDINKRATKATTDHAFCLAVDIDPRAGENLEAERARIRSRIANDWPSGVPAPTAIIDSGGGYWLYWRLAQPVRLDGDAGQVMASVEARNKQLALLFGGDHTHDVTRLGRLPGTTNWPDQKKAAKGRVPTVAFIVELHAHRAYSLDDFEPMAVSQATARAARTPLKIAGTAPQLQHIDELDRWNVRAGLKEAIVQGTEEGRTLRNDNSRSGWVFYVVCGLIRAGVPDETIFSILTDPGFGISESVLEQSKPQAYAERQISQAHQELNLNEAGWVETTAKGDPVKSFRNAVLALRRLDVHCRHNVFRDRLYVDGEGLAGEISGRACVRLRQVVIERFGFDPGKEHINDAMEQLAFEAAFDPVVDYLDEAQARWDGFKRLDSWLTTYMGAPARPMEAAVGRAMLVAAVRRARQPGCKFDFIAVLEGRQGSGKSSALRILAGWDDVFSDAELLHLDGKGQMEAVKGVWIYEIGELAGLRAADVEKVKAFASRTHDRARGAYERHVTDQPRRCIFVGTTNRADYLRDGTGNRRFWPVETGDIDLDALRRDRDQLWAEAATVEAEGGALGLPEHLWAEAAERQNDRVEEDPWLDLLRTVPWQVHTQGRKRVMAEATYRHLGIAAKDRSPRVGTRIKALMAMLGWHSGVVKVNGTTFQGYLAELTEADRGAVHGLPEQKEPF